MRKLFIMLVIGLLASISAMAQEISLKATFVDDLTHKSFDESQVVMALNAESKTLSLVLLPYADATRREALIDTIWMKESHYREAQPEVFDKYEEKNIFYLYDITPDNYLKSYVVFSQFIDYTQKGVSQIVIRKFDENEKRLWCVNINIDKKQAKEFFSLLSTAKKQLRMVKTTQVEMRPGADGKKQMPKFEDNRIVNKDKFINGTPYGTRW